MSDFSPKQAELSEHSFKTKTKQFPQIRHTNSFMASTIDSTNQCPLAVCL